MKNKLLRLFLVSTIFICLVHFTNGQQIYAHEETTEETPQDIVSPEGTPQDYDLTDLCDSEYILDQNGNQISCPDLNSESGGFGNLISNAFSSLNQETKDIEIDELYHKYFYEVHLQRSNAEANDAWNNVDTTDNTVVSFLTIIATMFNMLAFVFNLFTMLSTNLVNNNILAMIISFILDKLNTSIFDWGNVDGNGFLISIIIGMLLLVKDVLGVFKDVNAIRPSLILSKVAKMFLTVLLITASYTVLRPALSTINDNIESALVEIIYISDDVEESEDIPSEILEKRQTFNLVRYQSYLLTNFGVTSVSKLKNSDGDIMSETNAQDRVNKVIVGDKDAMNSEYNTYKNSHLPVDFGSAMASIFTSFLFLINSIILSIIISVINLVRILSKVLMVSSLYFIWVYALSMFSEDRGRLMTFLASRVTWIITYQFIVVTCLIALRIVSDISTLLMSYNIFLLLIADVLMLVVIYFTLKQSKKILNAIKKFIVSGKLTGMINGNYNPQNMFNDLKVSADKFRAEHLNVQNIKSKLFKEEKSKTNSTKESANNEQVVDNPELEDIDVVSQKDLKLDPTTNNSVTNDLEQSEDLNKSKTQTEQSSDNPIVINDELEDEEDTINESVN